MTEPHSHWEEHYSAKPRVWSGRVNARLAEVVPAVERHPRAGSGLR